MGLVFLLDAAPALELFVGGKRSAAGKYLALQGTDFIRLCFIKAV